MLKHCVARVYLSDLSCLVVRVCVLFCFSLCLFLFSTLLIGGAGSLMLDLYGWESVFYVSGLLSLLWAYCMWKYLLKGEGKAGSYSVDSISAASPRALISQLLICIIGVSVLMYTHGPVSVCVCRAYHHPGVPGKWWAPVQTVQKTLVAAAQTTLSLVR